MFAIRCVALALLTPLAGATTWIVDFTGGHSADFTDLPPAIAAAQTGDVIVVYDGTYSQVTGLSKGITIVGQGVVTLANTPLAYNLQIQNLPAGPPLAITNVRATGIIVTNAAASILMQRVRASYAVLATDAVDLRLDQMDGTVGSVTAVNSRVEIASCNVVGASGSNGQQGNPWFPAGNGAHGLSVQGTSRVQLARSSSRGGNGGWWSQAGDGGHGVAVGNGAMLFLDGAGIATIRGGNGGLGDDCGLDGDGGDGLRIDGGTVLRSGATYVAGIQADCGSPGQTVHFIGGSDAIESPDAPTLQLGGEPTPGGTLTYTVYSEPGSNVDLLLGRNAHVVQIPGIAIEELVVPLRTYHLGIVPASGQVTKTLGLPLSWPLGTRLIAQARVDMASVVETRNTNSAVVITR